MGVADVAVAGAAPLVLTDVFTDPGLVTMIVTDEGRQYMGVPYITVVIMTILIIRISGMSL